MYDWMSAYKIMVDTEWYEINDQVKNAQSTAKQGNAGRIMSRRREFYEFMTHVYT